MFIELTPVLVVGIVFLAGFKIIELFVHRKERLNLIDKIENDIKLGSKGEFDLKIFSDNSGKRYSAIRYGCLLVGFSLGVIVAIIIHVNCIDLFEQLRNKPIPMLYLASSMLFGGIGLLISYALEKGQRKDIEDK